MVKEDKVYDIVADIKLLSTNEGGRTLPLPLPWFGCPMKIKDEYFDCRIYYDAPIYPGDKVEGVHVRFLSTKTVLSLLNVGFEFTLWEQKTIASGVVTEINPLSL